MATEQDYVYMSQALRLAERGLYSCDPNPRVGCVLVKDNRIIGEGWHQKSGEAHAEVLAIENANRQDKNASRGATAYVTLEPCCHFGKTPPCVNALLNAGIQKVIIATLDPNPLVAGKGVAALQSAGIEVECGLLEAQAKTLNCGFFKRMQEKRPFVRLKLAMSLDGRTALSNGVSQWITSEAAREDVQKFRARSSAVMTGINTVLKDDPQLNVRWKNSTRQPLRIVLDSQLKTPVDAKIFKNEGNVLLVSSKEALNNSKVFLNRENIEVMPVQEVKKGRLDLVELMSALAERNINELLLECGATLAGEMMANKLVDEIIIYMAPTLLGHDARGLLNIPTIKSMQEKINVNIQEITKIGKDYRISATPENQ